MKQLNIPFLSGLGLNDDVDIVRSKVINTTSYSIDSLNWPNSFPYTPTTTFNIVRDEERMFIFYRVNEKYLRAVCSEDLSQVWTDSCVEFFVQIPGQEHYFNFEFNCIGICYAAKRASRANYLLLSDEDLMQIKRSSSLISETFEEKVGDFSWDLLVSIPLSLIGIENGNIPQKIHANFYKCGDGLLEPHYLSWNPIDLPKPDFHRPEFFGELYF